MTGRERRAVAGLLRVASRAVMGDGVPAARHHLALGYVALLPAGLFGDGSA
jgi:hypothetical protein